MPPTTRTPGDAHDSADTAIPERMTYVFKKGYLEALAGDDPALRDQAGAPRLTAICTAAGLDRATLHQIKRGNATLTPVNQGSLVALLERRGYTEDAARAALFERVPLAEAADRMREAVGS